MNYFDSNIIIYAILDDTEKGEWARDLFERVQKEEMPACTSFLTSIHSEDVDFDSIKGLKRIWKDLTFYKQWNVFSL